MKSIFFTIYMLGILFSGNLSYSQEPVSSEIKCQGEKLSILINRGRMSRQMWAIISGDTNYFSPLPIDSNQETATSQRFSGDGFQLNIDKTSNGTNNLLVFKGLLNLSHTLKAPVVCRFEP
jgi:hypothetical protein